MNLNVHRAQARRAASKTKPDRSAGAGSADSAFTIKVAVTIEPPEAAANNARTLAVARAVGTSHRFLGAVRSGFRDLRTFTTP